MSTLLHRTLGKPYHKGYYSPPVSTHVDNLKAYAIMSQHRFKANENHP